MPRRLGFLLIIAVLLAGAAWAIPSIAAAQAADAGPPPAPAPPGPARERPVPAAGHRDEAHWLVDGVCAEIARWSPGAATAPRAMPAGPGLRSYIVATGAGGIAIELRRHVWCADDYLPLARALGAATAAPAAAPAEPWRLLHDLASPTAEALLAADQRLAADLAAHPGDAGRHEQAALLVAVLAFREAAGPWCDARRELCAAAAHLAIAGRTGARGPAGDVAAALIDLIAGRTAAAEAAAAAFADPRLDPWARAIRRRARLDWRTPLAKDASVVERLAFARAVAYRRDGHSLLDASELLIPDELPDWGRIACEVSLSVQAGHAFANSGIGLDLAEAAAVHAAAAAAPPASPDELASFLNGKVRFPGPPRVIDGARWGAFLQRHLAHRLVSAHDHCHRMWGVAEAAAKIRGLVAGPLAGLRQAPMIRAQFEGDPLRDESRRAAAAAIAAEPGLLTPALAHELGKPAGLPGRDWWVEDAPPGTGWSFSWRFDALARGDRVARLEEARAMDPANAWILTRLAKAKGLHGMAACRDLYGPLADDDLSLAWDLKQRSAEGAERIAATARLAGISPTYWRHVAQLQLAAGDQAAAVEAYERLRNACTDRVTVSNEMGWLVEYYATHGRVDEAKAIAAECFEVYSSAGIETKARLDERLGDLDAAEAAYRALVERYGKGGKLPAFWRRTADRRPASKQALAEAEAAAFPHGRTRIALADCGTRAPTRGLRVTSDSDLSRRHGVRTGCIIVAIDGQACITDEQYLWIREESPDAPLRLIFWDGAAYRALEAAVPERRLRFDYEAMAADAGPDM